MARTRWLSRREQRAWRGFVLMQQRLTRRVARDLQAESGLSAEEDELLDHMSELPSGGRRAAERGAGTQRDTGALRHRIRAMAVPRRVNRERCATIQRGGFIAMGAGTRKLI